MSIDLNDLPDETLFLANDEFYEFIKTCLGDDEMLLFKIQSIKNIRALLNVPDVFAVVNIKCKELVDIQDRICFIDENNNNKFIVKAGVKGGVDDLLVALKEKTTEYIKRTKRSKTSSRSSNKNHSSTFKLSLNQSNLNSSNSTLVQATNNSALNAHSIDLTLTPSLATRSLNLDSGDSTSVPTDVTITSLGSIDSTPTPTTTTTASHSMSIKDYVDLISTSIEKFSSKNFTNITIENKQDYTIFLTFLNKDIEGYIKCKCNSLIKINYRSKTDSFQLSSYFKHIKSSQCLMMKKKRQQSNINLNQINGSSINFSQNSDDDIEEDFDDNNSTKYNDSFQAEINHSVSQNSSVVGKRRTLRHSTSSTIKKKSKT
ncbi:unnamed protein product [Adineta steineri]|uniref:Uncharacterized protein n=1 Tax=Adineta steineri TaxID=433720 RepID=A0A815TYJ3_9BILA|nr:unnamed protein product [Adineta steineri]CAF1227979.1 unnamed protein product [Adineta steineri]CAF1509302.1 unnamed protein product [Adineta steineri]CAF4026540.1 unnamed protein product [Adineta steineri]CAF4063179.1 unnamed protein product [Adineta steineri]